MGLLTWEYEAYLADVYIILAASFKIYSWDQCLLMSLSDKVLYDIADHSMFYKLVSCSKKMQTFICEI